MIDVQQQERSRVSQSSLLCSCLNRWYFYWFSFTRSPSHWISAHKKNHAVFPILVHTLSEANLIELACWRVGSSRTILLTRWTYWRSFGFPVRSYVIRHTSYVIRGIVGCIVSKGRSKSLFHAHHQIVYTAPWKDKQKIQKYINIAVCRRRRVDRSRCIPSETRWMCDDNFTY